MNNYSGYPIKKKAALLVCLFLFCGLPVSFAQDFAFDKTTNKAYQLILDLRFQEGKRLLPEPKTPQEIYVVAFAEALELIITEDPRQLSVYEMAFDKRLSRKSRKQNADELLLQAELHLQWAFIYLKFGRELDAAFRLRQAYLYAEEIQKKFPHNRAVLKTAGLLNVLIGSVPDKYNWILSLLNMEGSVNTGLAQMKTLTSSTHPFSFETTLWHAFTLGFILQQPEKAILEMNYLINLYPANPLATFLMANFHMKNASSEEALKFLQETRSPENPSLIIYTHYLSGEVYLHKAAYEHAIQAYSYFLQHYKGQNFVKDAHYKIGLCYWLDDKQDEAIIAFREAENAGKESSEADRHAAKNLAAMELPSVPLTKIRFYTDGGYYAEAEELIDHIDPATLSEKKHQVEFQYRKARLFHKQQRIEEAKKFYILTIESSGQAEWYYAPNSCLQLGYIAQSAGQIPDAKRFFEKALSYKRHEYKNSIDSKARSALAQLKDLR